MRRSIQSQYCSVITQTADTQSIPVLVSRKYVVPAAHEALIRVFSTARPEKDTLALIEPKIASTHTLDGMPQDEIWQSLIIAQTVPQWRSSTSSALVQVGNPSDRAVVLKSNTIVGTISPVTAISPQTASAITHNCSESSQARIDLTQPSMSRLKIRPLTVSSDTVIRSVYSVSISIFTKPKRAREMYNRWSRISVAEKHDETSGPSPL